MEKLEKRRWKAWAIVKNEERKESGSVDIYFANADFDADAYAKEVWSGQLIDFYQEKKVEAVQLLAELKMDADAAGAIYGIGTDDIGSDWKFVAEGTGKILEVNTESRAGKMAIDLQPYDEKADLILQIGPVIKGTAIRDTLTFIKLDDFSNQVEFADVSKAFNKLVVEEAINGRNFNDEVGKQVQFLGSFSFKSMDEILLTPIHLEIGVAHW